MTIIDLARTFDWSRYSTIDDVRVVWANHAPGIFYTSFAGDFGLTDEAYWIPDSAEREFNYVLSVLSGNTVALARVESIATLYDQPSFFWDLDTRRLYVRLQNFDPVCVHDIVVGRSQPFTDKGVVYLDDMYCAPLILKSPSVARRQDLASYDKPAFISGAIELANENGDLDDMITDIVIGNDVFITNLPDSAIDSDGAASRDDLQYLADLYVERYNSGLRRVSLFPQDRRKAQNVSIPTATLSVDDYANLDPDLEGVLIPLAYGKIREMPAIPVTGAEAAGAVSYRAAVAMTSFGTVYTLQDDVWTVVVPSASTLATGEFTLAEADSRNAAGGLFKCKLVDAVGIANTYASDVITDLFDRYLDVPYTIAHYATVEWEAEETALSTIGILFNAPVKLFDAIQEIQNGCNVGFRFEFLPTGQRAIRVDDWSRTRVWRIPNLDIQNLTNLEIENTAALLAAEILVEYARSYVTDILRTYLDDSERETVLEKYRQAPRLLQPTVLTSEAHALLRTNYAEERFSDIHGTVEIALVGSQYLDMRIYDIAHVEMNPGTFDLDAGTIDSDRVFYGLQKVQIIGVDPNFKNETNTIQAVLIEAVSFEDYLYTQGKILDNCVLGQYPLSETHRRLVETRDFTYV